MSVSETFAGQTNADSRSGVSVFLSARPSCVHSVPTSFYVCAAHVSMCAHAAHLCPCVHTSVDMGVHTPAGCSCVWCALNERKRQQRTSRERNRRAVHVTGRWTAPGTHRAEVCPQVSSDSPSSSSQALLPYKAHLCLLQPQPHGPGEPRSGVQPSHLSREIPRLVPRAP